MSNETVWTDKEKKTIKKFIFWQSAVCLIFILFGIALHAFYCSVAHETTVTDVKEYRIQGQGEANIYVFPITPKAKKESPKVKEMTAEKAGKSYTDKDLDLLARLIYSEGCSESYETKLKIGSVVLNRVKSFDFPNTIEEVIYQPNQFAVTFTKIDGVIMIDRPANEESIKAAKQLLEHGSVLPPEVQVFYAKGTTDNWVNTREVFEVKDNTVFAYIHPKL